MSSEAPDNLGETMRRDQRERERRADRLLAEVTARCCDACGEEVADPETATECDECGVDFDYVLVYPEGAGYEA